MQNGMGTLKEPEKAFQTRHLNSSGKKCKEDTGKARDTSEGTGERVRNWLTSRKGK